MITVYTKFPTKSKQN